MLTCFINEPNCMLAISKVNIIILKSTFHVYLFYLAIATEGLTLYTGKYSKHCAVDEGICYNCVSSLLYNL